MALKKTAPSTTAKTAKTTTPAKATKTVAAAKAASATAPDTAKVVRKGRKVTATEVVPPVAAAPELPRPAVTEDDIRVRAYYLSLEHRGHGGNLDFWLMAERQLRGKVASGE